MRVLDVLAEFFEVDEDTIQTEWMRLSDWIDNDRHLRQSRSRRHDKSK